MDFRSDWLRFLIAFCALLFSIENAIENAIERNLEIHN